VIGVSTVALHVTWIRYTFGGIGIVFLIYMGSSTWREKKEQENTEVVATAWTAKRVDSRRPFHSSIHTL